MILVLACNRPRVGEVVVCVWVDHKTVMRAWASQVVPGLVSIHGRCGSDSYSLDEATDKTCGAGGDFETGLDWSLVLSLPVHSAR